MTTHPSSQASDPLNHARRLIGGLAQLRWMLLPPLMVSLAAHAQAQDYTYTTTDGEVALTRYVGSNAMATIPGTIDGLPVTRIKSSAFQSLTNLESVTIPSSVTTIEATAFSGCTSLRSVMIPSSVTTMELYVFSGCTRLTSIDVEPNNPKYRSLDGVLFNKTLTTVMQYPGGRAGTWVLPGSVVSIDPYAFSSCSGLTAFVVEPSNALYTSIEGSLFNKSGTFLIRCPAAQTGPYLVPSTVTIIGSQAFADCRSLGSVGLPDGITTLMDRAFSGCVNLSSIRVPASVTRIGEEAFRDCPNMTSVYFQGPAIPILGEGMFDLTEGVTLYYLPELRVGSSLADRPAAVWRPRIEALGVVPREPASGMEFNMLWTSNRTVVVEACADLAAPIWSPVATITLTTDRDVFRDLQWTQSARRFYRLGSL